VTEPAAADPRLRSAEAEPGQGRGLRRRGLRGLRRAARQGEAETARAPGPPEDEEEEEEEDGAAAAPGGDPAPARLPAEEPGGEPGGRGLRRRSRGRGAADDDRSVPPPVPGARLRRRHWGVLLSFLLLVALPWGASGWYLWRVAVDQYASTVGFSVRREEFQSAVDLIGGIGQIAAGASSSDTDILYSFIRSQDMVARVDARLDLRGVWSRPWPADPVFAFNPEGTIEDLLDHWNRKVSVAYDGASGLLTLRVLAFDSAAAQAIATAIFEESSIRINELSAIAREDATRFARAELDRAVARLTAARQALTEFRLKTQIVDPQADIQGQMGLLNTLQAQLAAALIEYDLIREIARPGDPRVLQAERRIAVIEVRIAEERRKFGEGGQGPGGADYARLVAEFERLTVEREFAEETYRGALVAYDGALADAQRQSRYLAAHILPTRAERSAYPQRWLIFGLAGFFLLCLWAIGALIYYSLRDRR
jgi:capsular polysaccharide transport system permease protein